MIRGTTPAITASVPVDLTGMHCELTLRQGQTRVILTGDRLTVSAGETSSVVAFRLTQEETLNFDADKRVYVQIRVATAAGKALASNVMQASVHDILKDGVI